MQNPNSTIFIEDERLEWQQVSPGLSRKIMAHDPSLMLVQVKFEKGAVGALHQHVHVQISHVFSGVFEVEIEGLIKILKAGDSFFVPSNLWHGVKCLEEGILIDTFSPMREDFL
jgi:quercetin dioxygenase-like cupin family protein